jgi:methionyl aminopeptidase
MHEPPDVKNYGDPGKGMKLREGMVFAVEPMLNAGSAGTRLMDDGWTVRTKDGSLSAHVEHTICVTEHGPEIFTIP